MTPIDCTIFQHIILIGGSEKSLASCMQQSESPEVGISTENAATVIDRIIETYRPIRPKPLIPILIGAADMIDR